MKDADYNLVRDHCKPLAIEWIKRMGLGWHSIELYWTDGYFSMERDGHPANCVAFAISDWKYLQGAVTFSCAKLHESFRNGQPTDEVEEIIVHELGHILIGEMREYDKNNHDLTIGHEERVVTCMARAFIRTYQAGQDE